MPATSSDRWARRGPKDRARSKAFAVLLNEAVARWERRRGTPVSPSELARRVTDHLPDGRVYQLIQVTRVLEGDRAPIDDPGLVQAWLDAVPTLDRARVLEWWAGELIDHAEAVKIRSVLGAKPRSRDQRGRDKAIYERRRVAAMAS